jgi:hypothetical protein
LGEFIVAVVFPFLFKEKKFDMTLPRPASPLRSAPSVRFAATPVTFSAPALPVLASAAAAAPVTSPADAAAKAGFVAERCRRAAAGIQQAIQAQNARLASNLSCPSNAHERAAVERLDAAYKALLDPSHEASGAVPLTRMVLAQMDKADAKRLADEARNTADMQTQEFVNDWSLLKKASPREIAIQLKDLAALYFKAEGAENPVLAAAHAAAGLGMTARYGHVSAEIVDRSPMTIEVSMLAQLSAEDCRIQAIYPRKITDDGLLDVDIHRPNGHGFMVRGERHVLSPSVFKSRVVVPHDAYGVQFGETKIRLTDFSAPASAPEAAAAGTSDTAPDPVRSPQ